MRTGCDTVATAISARADGEEPDLAAEDIGRHLDGCAACTQFAEATETLGERLRAQPRPVIPDLSDRILAAIPEGPAPHGRFSGGRSTSAPGLVLVGVVTALILIAAFIGGRALAGGGGSGGGGLAGGGGNGVASVQQVTGSDQASSTYPGAVVLPVAFNKPTVTLTDTAGQPYNIAAATAGKITLVYFGYTHCPDVCPINMALAAQALAGMPAAQRDKVTMVFVTTDPARDTPPVIRAWLNKFSTSFIGLTGTLAQIQQAERQAGLPLSTVGPAVNGDGYSITHAGYTLAFSQDNEAHLQIDVSETVSQYSTTLEHLVHEGFVAH